jgi:hypothetical protein
MITCTMHLTLASLKQSRSGSIHTLRAFTLKRQERAPVFFQLAHAISLMACDAMLTSSSKAGGGAAAWAAIASAVGDASSVAADTRLPPPASAPPANSFVPREAMKFCVRRMYAMVLRASCTQQ